MADPLLKLKRQIQSLSLENQRSLLDWLRSLVEEPGEAEIPVSPSRQVVDSQQQGQITFRQELVRCGRAGCKCNDGELHGPYWYSYQRVDGKLKSAYIGKSLKG